MTDSTSLENGTFPTDMLCRAVGWCACVRHLGVNGSSIKKFISELRTEVATKSQKNAAAYFIEPQQVVFMF